jgi:CxxC-x17-CxxC domain-containing protein
MDNDRGRRDLGNREMHSAICSDCGEETQVPFKPVEGRPVYCRECFQKHRKPRSDNRFRGGGGNGGGRREQSSGEWEE